MTSTAAESGGSSIGATRSLGVREKVAFVTGITGQVRQCLIMISVSGVLVTVRVSPSWMA